MYSARVGWIVALLVLVGGCDEPFYCDQALSCDAVEAGVEAGSTESSEEPRGSAADAASIPSTRSDGSSPSTESPADGAAALGEMTPQVPPQDAGADKVDQEASDPTPNPNDLDAQAHPDVMSSGIVVDADAEVLGPDAGQARSEHQVGFACIHLGEIVCVGIAQKARLVCDAMTWTRAMDCGSDENCDSEDGSCSAVLEHCAGKTPGTLFCAGDDLLFACNDDLVRGVPREACSGRCESDADSAACVPPVCGDGKVQDPEEKCDDGNQDNEDACTIYCRAPECGDGLARASEECDDANDTDGDGCDSDCTASCHEDADCDDGNPCNGEELCDPANDTCTPGAALECDDHIACTADSCDPVALCQYQLIDEDGDGFAPDSLGACGADCDDGDPSSYPSAAELCDNLDNNCNGARDELAPTWYADCDGDGFAPEGAASVQQCEAPAAPPQCQQAGSSNWTSKPPVEGTTDCYDSNALVFPRTIEEDDVAWQEDPIPGRSTTLDFDYNCDGEEEPDNPLSEDQASCVPVNIGGGDWLCLGVPGWRTFVPECGQSGTLAGCSQVSASIVENPNDCLELPHTTSSAVQVCR